MKKLFLFSMLFITSVFFSQIDTIHLSKEKDNLHFPHFNQVYKGKIDFQYWTKNNMLEINENTKVHSFHIHFPSGNSELEYQLNGDTIPQNILKIIKNTCLNEEVFITKIYGINLKGELIIIPSMSIIPYIKDEH